MVVPVPLEVTDPGLRVNIQMPVPGKPFNSVLPEARIHVGGVITPTKGAEGIAFTIIVNIDVAALHGKPKGSFVVTVMITALPASPAAGV
jgi:hypothetical protein